MSEDLRAALAASERRTARAEEEARVARRERDEAVESAARLREALRTFAEDADEDEPPRDEGDERIEIYESAEDVSEDETSVSSIRAKLAAALDAARRARRDADAAARAARSRVSAHRRSREAERRLARTNRGADAATALARSRWRRPPRRCGGDWRAPKNENAATLAAAAEMDRGRAAGVDARARERDWNDARHGRDAGARTRRARGALDGKARKCNPPRERRAAAALAGGEDAGEPKPSRPAWVAREDVHEHEDHG